MASTDKNNKYMTETDIEQLIGRKFTNEEERQKFLQIVQDLKLSKNPFNNRMNYNPYDLSAISQKDGGSRMYNPPYISPSRQCDGGMSSGYGGGSSSMGLFGWIVFLIFVLIVLGIIGGAIYLIWNFIF